MLDIAVVDLPHISNATDLDALRAEPGVRVRVIRRPDEWGEPQAVILPGSRNSIADLRFMQATGLACAVRRFAEKCQDSGQGALVGICGGLQILGQRLGDPLGLEEGGEESGLGLLPLRTTLRAAKQLRRVGGRPWKSWQARVCRCGGMKSTTGGAKPRRTGQRTSAARLSAVALALSRAGRWRRSYGTSRNGRWLGPAYGPGTGQVKGPHLGHIPARNI